MLLSRSIARRPIPRACTPCLAAGSSISPLSAMPIVSNSPCSSKPDRGSRPQEGVPKGKLEGPTLFKSKIFEGTVREYWVYVPAQYTPDKPACVLVFQDGQRATNPNGVLRLPQVMENLIAKKQMPVTIGIFITPGARGEEHAEVGGG